MLQKISGARVRKRGEPRKGKNPMSRAPPSQVTLTMIAARTRPGFPALQLPASRSATQPYDLEERSIAVVDVVFVV
ncbi:hypothetical protein GGTG_14147 [Gaeumannomyces tritici R3-111a-1]|uniref:Uncharacterized protein n=1 Tax=Gaeumannomyces tritici (strain R3-111a-1) TaxID=644352 RepID=J3PKT0_GAET3|nr:hypothetical protein GGTG_14147 [Gaeumannomyces tritici R3-111a-1]EJT68274.1 hypothetical protein GGTG_14147 [Gaeumannomyces tritici R3-111a-1]